MIYFRIFVFLLGLVAQPLLASEISGLFTVDMSKLFRSSNFGKDIISANNKARQELQNENEELDSFINEIPQHALMWIYASASTYLIGVFFYLADSKIKYNHFIWHIFVLLASAFHYISIYFYI